MMISMFDMTFCDRASLISIYRIWYAITMTQIEYLKPPATTFAQVRKKNKTSTLRFTGPLWQESTGYRWIPLTKGQ